MVKCENCRAELKVTQFVFEDNDYYIVHEQIMCANCASEHGFDD